jgi:hypothetical protein
MVLSENEVMETALLRYAQRAATRWGAERFAAEFRRRDLEERWLEAARSGTSPYGAGTGSVEEPLGLLSGPVDDAVEQRAVDTGFEQPSFSRPKYRRHPSVPRPPEPEPGAGRSRMRRRERNRPVGDAAWMITPAEAARMSSAGRRLYGLEDPPAASG